jgi:hypothetical protein
MVPPVGLEPTLLSEPDFESGASTNSTTGARASGREVAQSSDGEAGVNGGNLNRRHLVKAGSVTTPAGRTTMLLYALIAFAVAALGGLALAAITGVTILATAPSTCSDQPAERSRAR